ncbi:hypothetical protein HKCCE4037_11225 [Rhodobacterales bacterium HKCCE4037]|nr:hypothetical protein [Rhodobacterales bacterium HKCCE4037]
MSKMRNDIGPNTRGSGASIIDCSRLGWLFLLMIFGLVSCMEAEPQWDVDAERRASDREAQCISREAVELDDGVSDALAIAQAVFAACRSEIMATIEVFSNGLSPSQQMEFREMASTETIVNITALVLSNRRQLRG